MIEEINGKLQVIINTQENFKEELKEIKEDVNKQKETLGTIHDAYKVGKVLGHILLGLGALITSLITFWDWLKSFIK